MSSDDYTDSEDLDSRTGDEVPVLEAEPEDKKNLAGSRRKRSSLKKPLYICQGVDSEDPKHASTFRVVAGPMPSTRAAQRHVRDHLHDGRYVFMYEGASVHKYTEPVTRINYGEEEEI